VGHKLEDVALIRRTVDTTRDQASRTREFCDKMAGCLGKMETRLNEMAGKMELQDETMRQNCATKGQVRELESAIGGHLEKIGANLVNRLNHNNNEVHTPTQVAKATQPEAFGGGLDNILLAVTGCGLAVIGTACLVATLYTRK